MHLWAFIFDKGGKNIQQKKTASLISGAGKTGRLLLKGASMVAQMVKDPPAMWETWVQFLGWEAPLEKGMATHFWGIKKMRLEQFLTAYTKINSNELNT